MTVKNALQNLAIEARRRAHYLNRRAGKALPGANEPRIPIVQLRDEKERKDAADNAQSYIKAAEMVEKMAAALE